MPKASDTGKRLVVIGGPTASGKTQIAIELALRLNTEIVSADSRQIYRELKVGAAPPDETQLKLVPHHLIATHSITDELNAASYASLAREALGKIWQTHQTALLVGGSGLFIKAITHGLKSLPGINKELRQEFNIILEQQGVSTLANIVASLDPEAAKHIDLQNPNRVIRALEVQRQSGLFPWQFVDDAQALDADIQFFYTYPKRLDLYEQINLRVDRMIANGLEDEARNLLPFSTLNALQTVGYKEWWPYFSGGYTWDCVVELIKQHTRNYAKRQLTWFSNQKDYVALDNTKLENLA